MMTHLDKSAVCFGPSQGLANNARDARNDIHAMNTIKTRSAMLKDISDTNAIHSYILNKRCHVGTTLGYILTYLKTL